MKYTLISTLSLGLLVSAVSAGCGDDTDTNPTGGNNGTTEVSLDKLGTETGKFFCGLAFQCCDMTELPQLLGEIGVMAGTEAECATKAGQIYDMDVLADIKASVMAGRQSYDSKKAAACFEVIQGQCSAIQGDPFEEDPNCNSVFVGLVAVGGECTMGDDCAGADTHCAGATDTVPGKCQVLPKEGEACPDFDCAEGLACSPGSMSNTCVKPNTKADGQMCGSDIECVSTYCSFTSGTCMAQKPLGMPCTDAFSNECKDSYCDGMTNTCTAKKADGQACMSYNECQSDDCDFMTMACAPVQGPVCDGK